MNVASLAWVADERLPRPVKCAAVEDFDAKFHRRFGS